MFGGMKMKKCFIAFVVAGGFPGAGAEEMKEVVKASAKTAGFVGMGEE